MRPIHLAVRAEGEVQFGSGEEESYAAEKIVIVDAETVAAICAATQEAQPVFDDVTAMVVRVIQSVAAQESQRVS